jgi:glycosyltransferase involved in cell wall biosynthesis
MSEHHHEPDAATTEPAGASADRSTIAFVGNYLPRMCGIATFTSDLCEAVAHQAPSNADVFAIALNDRPEGYAYPPRVRFEIRESLQGDYRLAADFVNIRQTSVVCLQHEYGIFGGPCGSHALTLLRHLRRPLVTTLHTVLKEPTEQELHVMQAVCKASNRVVVMSEIAHEMLHDVFNVPREKIVTVHHGIPDLPFVDPNFYKDQFGVEGKKVVLTFGLLSPN